MSGPDGVVLVVELMLVAAAIWYLTVHRGGD